MKSLVNLFSFLVVTLFVTSLSAQIQYTRVNNQDGMHTFEPSKMDATEYKGFKLDIGGAFTQGFQAMSHSNADTFKLDSKKLYALGNGFNLVVSVCFSKTTWRHVTTMNFG